jgi:uncharacterized membrane protein
MQESRTRSILKAITWRILATGTTFLLAYFVFRGADCEDALQKSTIVAGLEAVIKIFIYYFHERAWQMAPKGSVKEMFSSKKEA